ncbi:MAG: SCO family protein [Gammaproteobacteria bacterium]|nr:SCO family protein [Gammaproteobacteria bacterium]
MYIKVLLGLLVSLGLMVDALGANGRPEDRILQAQVPTGGDFTLQSVNGPVSTEDLRGKVILLYFGYTKCPDVCPTSLSFMTQALNGLTDEELKNVVGIFVSVDPKRDTVEILDQYVDYFHENYIGLTGTESEVAEVAKLYGAQYHEVELTNSAFGYSVNHSSVTYLIDTKGELKLIFPHETPPSVMLEGVRYLIAEG